MLVFPHPSLYHPIYHVRSIYPPRQGPINLQITSNCQRECISGRHHRQMRGLISLTAEVTAQDYTARVSCYRITLSPDIHLLSVMNNPDKPIICGFYLARKRYPTYVHVHQ